MATWSLIIDRFGVSRRPGLEVATNSATTLLVTHNILDLFDCLLPGTIHQICLYDRKIMIIYILY